MSKAFDFNIYNVTEVDRITFLKRTYAHVALAVLAFVVFEALLLGSDEAREIGDMMSDNWLIVLLLFGGGTWIANKWAHEPGNIQKQYLGLFTYAFLEALIFLPIFMYLNNPMNGFSAQEVGNIVGQAGIVTAGLFTGLSAIVLFSKKDFSFLKGVLMIGFGVAMATIIAGMIFDFDLGLWFSGAMVLLAGASILYQTSRIVDDYATDQHVAAAIGLFASLMLLFWYILRIFMSRD